ncbi:hypothetical protein P5V15_001233 [Pogonomyrmex californicus]
MAFNTFFVSACISSIDSKRCPQSDLLSLLNSQKSHGAKSGEYGGCGTIWIEFLAKCHEEPVQCEMAHYRGAKTMSCLPINLASWSGLIQMKCLQYRQVL